MKPESLGRSGRTYFNASLTHHPVAPSETGSLDQFLERQLAAGKAKKVALTACIRKLLITLNATLKHGSRWRDLTPQTVSHSY